MPGDAPYGVAMTVGLDRLTEVIHVDELGLCKNPLLDF
jgi:hypothetical protein